MAREMKKVTVDSYEGYCVPCKEKLYFQGRIEHGPTGRRQAIGSCPICDSTIVKVLGR